MVAEGKFSEKNVVVKCLEKVQPEIAKIYCKLFMQISQTVRNIRKLEMYDIKKI